MADTWLSPQQITAGTDLEKSIIYALMDTTFPEQQLTFGE